MTLYILYCEQAATPHRAKSASPFRILAVVTAQIRKQSQDGNIKPDDCNQQPKRPIPLHILGCGAGICRLLDELEVDDQIQRSNHHHGEAEANVEPPFDQPVDHVLERLLAELDQVDVVAPEKRKPPLQKDIEVVDKRNPTAARFGLPGR